MEDLFHRRATNRTWNWCERSSKLGSYSFLSVIRRGLEFCVGYLEQAFGCGTSKTCVKITVPISAPSQSSGHGYYWEKRAREGVRSTAEYCRNVGPGERRAAADDETSRRRLASLTGRGRECLNWELRLQGSSCFALGAERWTAGTGIILQYVYLSFIYEWIEFHLLFHFHSFSVAFCSLMSPRLHLDLWTPPPTKIQRLIFCQKFWILNLEFWMQKFWILDSFHWEYKRLKEVSCFTFTLE